MLVLILNLFGLFYISQPHLVGQGLVVGLFYIRRVWYKISLRTNGNRLLDTRANCIFNTQNSYACVTPGRKRTFRIHVQYPCKQGKVFICILLSDWWSLHQSSRGAMNGRHCKLLLQWMEGRGITRFWNVFTSFKLSNHFSQHKVNLWYCDTNLSMYHDSLGIMTGRLFQLKIKLHNWW